MNVFEAFKAQLPTWRADVETWLDTLPASVRTNPRKASCLYLLNAPTLAALGSEHLRQLEPWWVGWRDLRAWAEATGRTEQLLVEAAAHLEAEDPGPALGLMLVAPNVPAFAWAHAAGTLHELVRARLHRTAFTLP